MKTRTSLSNFGHRIARRTLDARWANAGLERALRHVQSADLGGVRVVLSFIHFGPGVFQRGMRANPHTHAEFQSEFVLSGRIRFQGERGRCELGPGDGLWIAPAVPHSWQALRDTVMVGTLVKAAGPGLAGSRKHLANLLGNRLARFRTRAAITWAERWLDLLATRPAGWEVQTGNLLGVWLWETARMVFGVRGSKSTPAQGVEAVSDSRSAAATARALSFMRANYMRPLSVRDVALQVGVTTRHLERLCTRQGLAPVGRTLALIRLEEARRILAARPDLLAKEVSFACGFRSPSYFAYCYHRAFGHAPRQR